MFSPATKPTDPERVERMAREKRETKEREHTMKTDTASSQTSPPRGTQQPPQVATQPRPVMPQTESMRKLVEDMATAVSICPESRIVETMPALLDPDRVIWHDGHAWCPDCKKGVGCDKNGHPFAHACSVELDLIALAHLPVEEVATQLLAKHSVSAEEFRVFWEIVRPSIAAKEREKRYDEKGIWR